MAKNIKSLKISMVDGEAMVATNEIGRLFGYGNRRVMDMLETYVKAYPAAERFFKKSTFKNRKGDLPNYLMTKDGYILLCIKIIMIQNDSHIGYIRTFNSYLDMFNKAEEELRKKGKDSQKAAEGDKEAAEITKVVKSRELTLEEVMARGILAAKTLLDRAHNKDVNEEVRIKKEVEKEDESNHLYSLVGIVKKLNIKGVTPNKLSKELRRAQVLDEDGLPFTYYTNNGYFKEALIQQNKESKNTVRGILFTPKGLDYVNAMIKTKQILKDVA